MQEIDIVNIRKKAKFVIFKRNFYHIIFNFFYYFIKSLYWIIKIATLGIISIFTSALVFPLTIDRSRKYIKLFDTKNQNIDINFYYLKHPLYSINKIIMKLFLNIFTFLLALIFIVPGIWFYFNLFPLPYVIAENPNITYKNAINLSASMTKGRLQEIVFLYLSFFGWFVLSILSLGISSFFSWHYFECSKCLYYIELKKQYKNQILIDTSLLSK